MVVKHVTSKDEFAATVKGNSVVVVDFYATWCGPCKRIAPAVEQMSEKYQNVIFIKVDVDELEDVAKAEAITAMPTFRVYKGGKSIDELVGASTDKLEAMIVKNSS